MKIEKIYHQLALRVKGRPDHIFSLFGEKFEIYQDATDALVDVIAANYKNPNAVQNVEYFVAKITETITYGD